MLDGIEAGRAQPAPTGKPSDTAFNWERIETEDDLKRTMDAVTQEISEEMNRAGRGSKSFEAQLNAAAGHLSDLTNTSRWVINRKRGETWNAEQMLAARRVLVSQRGSFEHVGEHRHVVKVRR